jgi:hypothetical protein
MFAGRPKRFRGSRMLRLNAGQTDCHQRVTLETAHCLGSCALAPVVQIDSQYFHDPGRKKLEKIIGSFENEEKIHATGSQSDFSRIAPERINSLFCCGADQRT